MAENEEPRLSHLRESGTIEQDANLVIFLHQNKSDNDIFDDKVYELIIAKNRQGKTGKKQIIFDKKYQLFYRYNICNGY